MRSKEMLGRLRNSFAEVDLSALEQNYVRLQAATSSSGSPCLMAPMIKANAYGHGDVQVARICEKRGARYLGVVLIEEGIRLRLAGIQTPILVFTHFDAIGAEALVQYRLTPVLSQFEQFAKMKNALHDHAAYPVHVKFNTGMQRMGFEPADAVKVAHYFTTESAMRLEGVCTHFCASEDFGEGGGSSELQISLFKKIMNDMKPHLQVPALAHYLNSGAILTHLEPKLDVARPGIALYGALPQLRRPSPIQLEPVMSVKSFIAFMHRVPKGAKVSYGGTWQAPRDAVIGVVPVGYADGVPRSLSNRGKVLVRGEICAITGIICMDYLMIDVTALTEKNKGPVLGDEVVLFGRQGEAAIRVEEVAQWAQTIPYEILTGINHRMPRVYVH